MNMLHYRRWDDQIFEVKYEKKDLSKFAKIQSAQRVELLTYKEIKWDKDSYSYGDVKFILGKQIDGAEYDHIQLYNKHNEECIWFDRKDFIYWIEFETDPSAFPSDVVKVETLEDYIAAVEAYRFLSFVKRIKEIALFSEGQNQMEKDVFGTIFTGSKINSIHANDKGSDLFKRINSAITSIENELNNQKSKLEEILDRDGKERLSKIEQTIHQFKKGVSFQYYRGVGHIIFPEIPGVLRGNNRFHEDEYYRNAKTKFPKELAGLRYLDRLAKIQHYGWPTRLLDVTSNPLVALYMACNTVYNLDDKELKDFGEVIIYFNDDDSIEKSYDSKAVLINAALVKLNYEERKAMFEFINMHNMFLEHGIDIDEEKKEGIRNSLNFCLHIAVDRGADTVMHNDELLYVKQCLNEAIYKEEDDDDVWTPGKCAYACLRVQDLNKKRLKIKKCSKDEDPRLRFPNSGQEKDRYPIAFKEELDINAYLHLFKYFIKAYDKLLVTIRRENSAFQNKIDIFQMLKSYHVRVGMSNDRMLAQGGSFLIVGVDDRYIGEHFTSSRTKKPKSYMRVIINDNDKAKILQQLDHLAINDSTMLPDLQHTGEYMKKILG